MSDTYYCVNKTKDSSTKDTTNLLELAEDGNQDKKFSSEPLLLGDDNGNDKNITRKPYNFWRNCGLMMTIMFTLSSLIFVFVYFCHKLKLWGAKPFNPNR